VGLDHAVLFRVTTSERVSDPGAADRVVEEYVELAGALPPPVSEAWL
jgi:hypothetical protein